MTTEHRSEADLPFEERGEGRDLGAGGDVQSAAERNIGPGVDDDLGQDVRGAHGGAVRGPGLGGTAAGERRGVDTELGYGAEAAGAGAGVPGGAESVGGERPAVTDAAAGRPGAAGQDTAVTDTAAGHPGMPGQDTAVTDAAAGRPGAAGQDTAVTDTAAGRSDLGRQDTAAVPGAGDGAAGRTETTGQGAGTATEEGGQGTRLIPTERISGYRERWNELKGAFVDDPGHAVRQIDELVGEVLDEIHEMFRRQRAELGSGIADQASTEDLRVAFGRYREFFDRLLSF